MAPFVAVGAVKDPLVHCLFHLRAHDCFSSPFVYPWLGLHSAAKAFASPPLQQAASSLCWATSGLAALLCGKALPCAAYCPLLSAYCLLLSRDRQATVDLQANNNRRRSTCH